MLAIPKVGRTLSVIRGSSGTTRRTFACKQPPPSAQHRRMMGLTARFPRGDAILAWACPHPHGGCLRPRRGSARPLGGRARPAFSCLRPHWGCTRPSSSCAHPQRERACPSSSCPRPQSSCPCPRPSSRHPRREIAPPRTKSVASAACYATSAAFSTAPPVARRGPSRGV